MTEFANKLPVMEINIAAAANNILGSIKIAPFGRAALNLLHGPQESTNESDVENATAFPEERIAIPTNLTPKNVGKYDHYQLLGFSKDWADSADTDAIRKAYHKAVLIYHPDKAKVKSKNPEEDRAVFLKIQEAFNVLSNEHKRRAYDSQLPFDETIPSEEDVSRAMEKDINAYFALFDSVFKRNARFASKKPVPNLGDLNTPLSEVMKFYEYWVHFESWRDYSGLVTEYNVDNANSRDEKRWMQKEIERIARKHKKKEMDRIIELVMLAQKKDPRIAADREAKRLAKEKESKRKADEEMAAKLALERAEVAAQEKAAADKLDKEKLKKLQARARNTFRKLVRQAVTAGISTPASSEFGMFSADDVEMMCTQIEFERLQDLNEAMGGEPATKEISGFVSAGFEAVKADFQVLKQKRDQAAEEQRLAMEAKKKEAEAKAKAAEPKKAVERTWSRDYMSMLAKGVSKHPAGLNNRWQLITNFMNEQLKPSNPFTQEELIKVAFQAAKPKGR